ncbi:MAG: D-lysine 5,6-aminomutase subunit alpha [Deltaproteobacteria bacterium]|nr:MAG: D-lysine 5,6-aminomutase subunit alpha [Deltaproteobacteria bacterium]
MSKLNLDRDKVESCRVLARKIAGRVQDVVNRHTTVSIERSVLRLLGVEEAYKGMPLVNLVIDSLTPEQLSKGIFYWIGRALVHQKTSPISICLKVADKKLKWENLPDADLDAIQQVTEPLARQAVRKLEEVAFKRRKLMEKDARHKMPLKYLIVATGNIHDDVDQAVAAVESGADCIAVIRSTAQSLLDYVPNGLTTEGFGGTFATQENFRLMREALDEAGEKIGRYIRLVNYSSGLCMPEIAVMGALERLDFLLNDSMYGILFRDINMKRTFTDQYFSRLVIARSGIVINTGEDNYLTTAESFRSFHQVLASQFINEQMGFAAKLKEEQLGLGHAFEMDPSIEDSLLYEIAQAAMVREIFPNSPIKYMPPTRHMTGDIFFGHVLDTMFNLVSVMTHQGIHLLGMPTEAIHNPLLQDRHISQKSVNYIFNAARSLGDEIAWSENGKVIRRSRTVLEETYQLLHKVEQMTLMKAISQGMFAHMVRDPEGGRGLEGVIEKDKHYWNPILRILEKDVRMMDQDRQESPARFFREGGSRREQNPRRFDRRGNGDRRRRNQNRRRGPRREAGEKGETTIQAKAPLVEGKE